MPGIRKRTVTYRRMADFSPILETVNRRQLLGLSSPLSKCHQTKWHHSSQDQRPHNQRTYGILHQWSRTTDFKFANNFIICDTLPDMEILFGIDIQKKVFPVICLGIRKRTVTYRWMADFSLILETVNRRQLLGLSGPLSKIPPDTMASFQSRPKVTQWSGHMAYFISDQDSTKGKDPNINIINGIHNIKGKTSVNILMSK